MKVKTKKDRARDLDEARVAKKADQLAAKLTRTSAGQLRVTAASVLVEEARQALQRAMQALSAVTCDSTMDMPSERTTNAIYRSIRNADEDLKDVFFDLESFEDWVGLQLDRDEPQLKYERPWIEIAARVL